MLHMQIDSFGSDDERCKATGKKIYILEHQRVQLKGTDVNNQQLDEENIFYDMLSLQRNRNDVVEEDEI